MAVGDFMTVNEQNLLWKNDKRQKMRLEINRLRTELAEKELDLAKFEERNDLLVHGECWLYVGQADKLNDKLACKNVEQFYIELMQSQFVRVEPYRIKEMPWNCFEYYIDIFGNIEFKRDTSTVKFKHVELNRED